jgi:predicted extracellular nuclease
MRVRLDADSALKISRNFSYDYAARRNNLVLAHGAPLMKPTQLHVASSPEAVALAEANASNRVFLESDVKAGDGKLPGCPPGSRSRVTCASAMPRSIWRPWSATATTSTA